jgi:GntR family carbon starvation induced transcriptional regulator
MKSPSDNNTAVAKTIADQTYQHIRRDIISGALPPGTKLAMEMLTQRYDVGLSPLREALVKLTGDALAVAEGQRGFWVSQISLDELQGTMSTRLLIETQALSVTERSRWLKPASSAMCTMSMKPSSKPCSGARRCAPAG